MLRVLHLSKYLPSYPGGLELVAEQFALAACELGASVQVAGVANPYGEKEIKYPFEQLALKSFAQVGPVALAPGYFNLEKQLRQADVIHLHMPNPLAELALLKYFAVARPEREQKFIPIIHAGVNRFQPLGYLWERYIQKALLKLADRVIVGNLDVLTAIFNLREYLGKATVIPFPVRDPGEVLDPLSVKEGRFTVATVGRLVPYKGHEVLIQAMAQVPSDVELIIAGDGPELSRLQLLVEQLGLRERVKLSKHISNEEKDSLLKKADLFVLPSLTKAESFGMAIVEAFSYGKAVITTDIPTGVAFLARGGRCGAMVKAGSVPQLADAITLLSRDRELRLKSGIENRKFFERHLGFKAFRENYGRLIISENAVTPEMLQESSLSA